MGGVSAGVRDNRNIEMANPAGASARDSLTFVIDFGGELYNIYAASDATRSSFNSANFHHLAVAFPIWGTRCGINFGFQPYTRVGYDIEEHELRPEIISRAGDVRYQYRGEDGLSQIFLNVGYNILPQWAIGVGAKYIFGEINRYYNTLFYSNSYFFGSYANNLLQVNDLGYSIGTQYTHRLSGDRRLTLGLTVAPPVALKATESTYSVTHSLITTVEGYADTAYSNTSDRDLDVPLNVSGGISFSKPDKWLIGADFSWADWSRSNIGSAADMGLGYDIKLGGYYIPNRYDVRYYSRRITYRAGLRYSQTPVQFNGSAIYDRAASVGLGFPLKNMGDVNLSVSFGTRGTTAGGGVRENYLYCTASITLFEYWFMKYKYD
jgi:hypothetical protein